MQRTEVVDELVSTRDTTLRFDHLGMVVERIEVGREFLSATLGIDRWTEVVEDHGLGVSVQFGMGQGGPCYELVAPLGPNSPVAGALRGGKHILHHVAYRTPDLDREGERLREQGCHATGAAAAAAAYGGRRVQFWVSPLRFMIELVEAPEHEHRFGPGMIGVSEA